MSSSYESFFKNAKKSKESGKSAPRRKVIQPQLANKKIKAQKPDKEIVLERLKELKKNKRKYRKSRQKAPMGVICISIMGLIITAYGFLYPEDVESFFTKVQVRAFSKVKAQEKNAQPKDKKKEDIAESSNKEKAPKEADGEVGDSEKISNFKKLADRKKELDQREVELNKLEEELHKQKLEIEARIKKLERIRREISSTLEDKVKVDEKKVNKLVDVYSNMKPQQAAEAFEKLDEDLTVEILGKMKKKDAANIMNLLKPEKTQSLTEKFAGYKR